MKEGGSTHCICLLSGLQLTVDSGYHPARCVRRACVNDNFTLIHLPLNSAVIYSELITASPTQQRMHSLNNCRWFRDTVVTLGSYFIPLIYSACPACCALIKIPFKHWQLRLHVVWTSVFESRPCTVSSAREILCIENFFFFHPTTWRHILCVFHSPGLFCYPCVKVKFPHRSWQVWNYDRKCFIPCHLPSFITAPYVRPRAPSSPQLTGWYGSHSFNRESESKIPHASCLTVSKLRWGPQRHPLCLWSCIEYRGTKVQRYWKRGWK